MVLVIPARQPCIICLWANSAARYFRRPGESRSTRAVGIHRDQNGEARSRFSPASAWQRRRTAGFFLSQHEPEVSEVKSADDQQYG